MTNKRRLVFFFAVLFVIISLTVGVIFLNAGIGWLMEVTAPNSPDCSTVSYDGDGTETNPYEVSNVEQLQCIREHDLEANYVQVSDIDASETSSWHDGWGFVPIGKDTLGTTESHEFNGTFDGNGYNITDLTIEIGAKTDDYKIGMFSTVGSSGKVTNVSIADIHIQGGLLGSVGGIAGVNRGTIENSYVSGSVRGTFRVGGLVGLNDGGKIRKSYATGQVDGDSEVGGLVGGNYNGTINGSHSAAEVKNWDGLVGGLVGENKGGTIRESYATGDVRGRAPSGGVGGLVGANYQGKIESSYATGDVDGYEVVGGLVGNNTNGSKINESYAVGSVEGDERAGGLIGVSNGRVTNSYWDVEATGQPTSTGNGTGLTTVEMTGSAARDNMRGFDFMDTWRTVPEDYPALAWQEGGERDERE